MRYIISIPRAYIKKVSKKSIEDYGKQLLEKYKIELTRAPHSVQRVKGIDLFPMWKDDKLLCNGKIDPDSIFEISKQGVSIGAMSNNLKKVLMKMYKELPRKEPFPQTDEFINDSRKNLVIVDKVNFPRDYNSV